jgi:NADH-ubiquinone oxidoreductase chain 4
MNILSLFYTSMATLRQIDIKKIIAYSSISHMNICAIGILSFNIVSISGSMILMFGHGFVSAGLFFLIGIIYDKYKTKLFFYYSGIVHTMPIYSFFLFFFILSNISMPLTSNFIGEFLILYGLMATINTTLIIFIAFAIFICAVYSI